MRIVIAVLVGLPVFATGFYMFWNNDVSKKEQRTSLNDQGISSVLQDNSVIPENDNAPRVLYAYEQFSPTLTKIYQSDISGKSKAEVDIGYAERVRFMTSKDGKHLARLSKGGLEISSAPALDSFKKIVEISAPNTGMGGAIWSVDGEKLVYILSRDLKPPAPLYTPTEKKLYVINRDGTGRRLVKQFQKPNGVTFEAFDASKNELYWFEMGHPSPFGDLNIIDLSNGSVKETNKYLVPESFLSFTSDFSKAYYIEDNKIYEYTLVDGGKRILYELDDTSKDKYGNQRSIGLLKLSPKNDRLIFTRTVQPDDRGITISIALPSGKIEALVDDVRYPNISPLHWSPEGRYLWFETLCPGCEYASGYNNEGEYYIMDMETKVLQLFFKGSKGEYEKTGQGVRVNESLEFIGWITE